MTFLQLLECFDDLLEFIFVLALDKYIVSKGMERSINKCLPQFRLACESIVKEFIEKPRSPNRSLWKGDVCVDGLFVEN